MSDTDAANDAAGETLAARTSRADIISKRSGEEWYSRGRSFYRSEDWGDAAMAYLRAAAAGYRTETAYYNAACSFALDGQTDAALEALENALDAGFDRPDLIASDDDLDSIRSHARFQRLRTRAMSTDHATAEKTAALHQYESLRASRSTDSDEWRSVGVDLMRAGETARAIDAFATEFAIDSSASTLYNMACAYSLGGNRRAALDMLERSILAGYGNVDHMKKDADLIAVRGEARFERLVELARSLELEFPPMGGRGTWRRALPRYEAAAEEYPEAGRAWFNLGYARLRAGDAAGSVEANRRALSLGYRPGTTMYNLACSYAVQGRVEDAFRWLERAEAAGAKVGGMMESDDDLDALRSDARFKRYVDRARAERRAEKLAKRKQSED